MDKQLKRLVERLLSEYEVRPLNENIFKKLNAVYGNQPQQKNLGKVYNDAMAGVVQPLITATDRQDIRNYFIDTFKLDAVFKDMVDITIGYINGRQGDIPSSMRRWSDEVIYPDLGRFLAEELNSTYKKDNFSISADNDGDLYFNCTIAGIRKQFLIKLRDAKLRSLLSQEHVTTGTLKFQYDTNILLGHLVCSYTKDDSSVRKPKVAKAIAEFNKNQNLLGDKFDKFLNEVIDNVFNVDRLEEELFCQEKVYKVVDKDIMRQANIFNNSRNGAKAQLNGFDAITDPKKMAARAAATFICAKYMGRTAMELKVDDNTLIRLFTNTNFIGTDRFDCESLLSRIRKDLKDGVHIHLKDVIATFLAYKDDPKILESCKKYC